MPENTDITFATRRALSGPENLERILLGVCTAIWLAALGAAVAAGVALVDLGRGRGSVRAELSGASGASGSETPWVLYTVIGISAAVIALAIPLLIRARQQSQHRPIRSHTPAGGSVAEDIAAVPVRETGRRRADKSADAETRSAAFSAVVDQVHVRYAMAMGCAVGAATLSVAVATYLMATDKSSSAIAFLIIAGMVTVAMPTLPWFHLRELRAVATVAH